jgi:glycosyltransferase involved in cell wall biosynthesis
LLSAVVGAVNAPIRVLHLGSPSGLYGAERWIISLISHLEPGRIESLVGAVNDGAYDDVPLCRMAQSRGFQSVVIRGQGKVNLGAVRKLRQYIVDNRIDILHTHFYKADLIGLLAARGTNCFVMTTPHGWAVRPSPSLWVYERLTKLCFPLMDAVVPLSTGLMQSLRWTPGLSGKVYLIENAVDLSEAKQDCALDAGLATLRASGKFILGYVGRLDAGKDLETLLRAMAGDHHPDWHAVLVGAGEHGDPLRALVAELAIADRVTFTGYREDRMAFLKGFDVFVLPSRSEGIPRCLMEAMAAGIPIVASDIPGCRNLVDGSSTGLLFPVGDERALRERVVELAESAERRASIVDGARRFIEAKFSCERMAREYELLYENLILKRNADQLGRAPT